MTVPVERLREKFKLPIHTTFYRNLFILHTDIIINRQHAVIGLDSNGGLTLNSRYPQVGMTLDSLLKDVNSVLQTHGMETIANYWHEEMPLFELKVSLPEDLKNLFHQEEKIKEEIAEKIANRLTAKQQPSHHAVRPPRLHVKVQLQVYLVVPDYMTNNGKTIEVTEKSITECMNLFEDSGVFDFEAVFRASHTNPKVEDKV